MTQFNGSHGIGSDTGCCKLSGKHEDRMENTILDLHLHYIINGRLKIKSKKCCGVCFSSVSYVI